MWQVERFESREAMLAWIEKHEGLIQYDEIFIENGYAVEWRKLRTINLD